MDTMRRVKELSDERNLTIHQLARQCEISYTTLSTADKRSCQLSVNTIERICRGLGITLSEFFVEKGT